MTAIDTRSDLEILSSLDFTPRLACEHSQHSQTHIHNDPAYYVVLRLPKKDHKCVREGQTYLCCKSGWLHMGAGIVRCPCPKRVEYKRDDILLIIGTVKDIGGK